MEKISRVVTMVPIRITGMIVALHSILYGIGYIIPAGGFRDTVLYENVLEILPPEVFGVILLVTGLLLIYGFAKERLALVSRLSNFQSFVWLFATFVYMLDGSWLLGLGIGLVWSMLSAHVSYAFCNKEKTIDALIHKRLAEE